MPDLTDVAWDLIDSPLGTAFAACTPAGLCALHVDAEPELAVARLDRALGVRASRSPAQLAPVGRELDAYFEGRLREFSLAVDLRLVASAFMRAVLFETVTIPYGSRRTYGRIARDLGRPRAARAVGAALARNPVWIVVPCHRVVGADGNLTGYAGGLDRKRALLNLEEVGGLLAEAEADPRPRALV